MRVEEFGGSSASQKAKKFESGHCQRFARFAWSEPPFAKDEVAMNGATWRSASEIGGGCKGRIRSVREYVQFNGGWVAGHAAPWNLDMFLSPAVDYLSPFFGQLGIKHFIP